MRVPFVDLLPQHREISLEVEAGWREVTESAAYIMGPQVSQFEQAYAEFESVGHCVGVANGTDAIELAARVVGVEPGDEVILPANTFIATALAVMRLGAKPVLVDCDPESLLIDVEAVSRAITRRTRAVIAVHLYGQIAPVEELASLLEGTGIVLIEDAAQSQGARRHGKGMAAVGAIAATSFYPGKNLGAYGDAGAVLTQSEAYAQRLRAIRNYGSEIKYHHPSCGFNSRLDTMQAVVLLAKLKRLNHWNSLRVEAARRYHSLLAGLGECSLPVVLPGNDPVWHLYVVRVPNRHAVLKHLLDDGIQAAIHYPVPLHIQGAMEGLGHRRGDFPATEAASDSILSLPIYPGITSEQQETVAESLLRFFS